MLVTVSQAAHIVRRDQRAVRWHIDKGHLHPQAGEDGYARLDTDELASVRGWRIDRDRLSEIQDQDARSAQSLSERIRILERRIASLERIIANMTPPDSREAGASEGMAIPGYPDAPNGPTTFSARYRAIEARGTLPDGLVMASRFVESHGIPRMTWMGAMRTGRLPVVEGEWKVGRNSVKHALAAEGRAAVYRLWADRPDFRRCAECPHGV